MLLLLSHNLSTIRQWQYLYLSWSRAQIRTINTSFWKNLHIPKQFNSILLQNSAEGNTFDKAIILEQHQKVLRSKELLAKQVRLQGL